MSFWNISTIADTIQNRFRDQAEFGAGAALIEEKHEIYMELNGISDDNEVPYFSRDLFLEIKGDGKIDVLLQGKGGSPHKVFTNPVEAMDWIAEEMNLYEPKFLQKMKSQSRRFQASGSEFTLYKEYLKRRSDAWQLYEQASEDSPEQDIAWEAYSKFDRARMNRSKAESTSEKTFGVLENLYSKEAISESKLHAWASRIKDPNTAVSLAYTGWKLAHGRFTQYDSGLFQSYWKSNTPKIKAFGELVEQACTARFWEIFGVQDRVKPEVPPEPKWVAPAIPANLIPQDADTWQIYDTPGAGRVAKALATATATILAMAGRNITPGNTDAKNVLLVRKLRARMNKVLNTYAEWGAADGESETVMLRVLRMYVGSYLKDYRFPKTVKALNYWD